MRNQHRRSAASFACVSLALAALVMASGCSSPIRAVRGVNGPTPVVEEVELQGVKRFSKEQLLSYLHVNETSSLPFSKDYFVDPAFAAVDARRIEEAYHSHGYYQARVLAIEPVVDEDGESANVRIRVEEGLPARVTSLQFVWTPDSTLSADERKAVEARASLKKDGPFETVLFEATMGELRTVLLQQGFPLAKVQGSADVHEGARQAEVELRIAPGPHAVIRSVRLEGLVDVRADLCAPEVEMAIGKPYSPAITSQVEDALKSMRVFRWVATVPPSQVVDGKIDLVVRVSEADPHSITVGPELSIDSVRWQEQLSATYTYTNLFHNLTRLDLKAVAGYAELPNPWDHDEHGPVASLSPSLRKKGILEPFLIWSITPTIGTDIQQGYKYWNLGYRGGVSRWFAGMFTLGLTHNLNRVDYYSLAPTLDRSSTQLGLDFLDPYVLSYLELQSSLYLVDAIKKPTRGVVVEGIYDLAGGVFQGEYDYQKLMLVLRGYYKPFERLQLVSRLQGGTILPYGDNPGAPIGYRFYLGGPSAVRGFGSRRLSPKLEDCPDDGGDCKLIPIGGYSMVQGSLELRLTLASRLALVGFGELGDVVADESTFTPSTFSYTAGPGLRVDTPLGLVRLDAGFRLNHPEKFAAEPGYALYLGLGEAL